MPVGHTVVFSVNGVTCRSEPFADRDEARDFAVHLRARGGVEVHEVEISEHDEQRLR